MENFRTLKKSAEIISLIQKANLDDIGQVWQTLEPFRHVYKILKVHLDDANKALIFETSLPFEFDRSRPVYIRISNRDLIFKLSTNYILKNNRLICTFPAEAKAVEMRKNERLDIPVFKSVEVVLRPMDNKSADEVKVKLHDFSKKGLGIIIPDVNEEYFHRIQLFSIVSIDGVPLKTQIISHVRHIGGKIRGHVKIGMALHEAFEEKYFLSLKKTLLI